MGNKDKEDNTLDLLLNIPNEFELLNSDIESRVQREYIKLSRQNNFFNQSENEIIKEGESLLKNLLSPEEKRRLLILLAHLGNIKAYRIIENYLKHTDNKELKKWAQLAFQECRMLLGNHFLKESQGFISTGLGGNKNKLRYFVVIIKEKNSWYDDIQIKVIKNEFDLITKRLNLEIEKFSFQENYASLIILVPIDVAVGKIIEQGITRCNRKEHFLSEKYIVTNTEILTEAEIKSYLKRLKRSKF